MKIIGHHVLVTQKLICKGFERYSRKGFCLSIDYLCCNRALFSIDDSILNELLEEADTKDNMLAAST